MSKKIKVYLLVMVGIPEKRIFFWIAITKKKRNNSSYVRPCLSSIKKVLMTKKGTTPGQIANGSSRRNFKINPPLKASTPSISKVLLSSIIQKINLLKFPYHKQSTHAWIGVHLLLASLFLIGHKMSCK